jgi:cellobiose phosphorylase
MGQKTAGRKKYDCDTYPYWCSDEEYISHDRKFGRFIENGGAYEIFDPDTPRPWLNYFANKKFGSVVCNRGKGFNWYVSPLLRITRYEHPVDYLPREFEDGRVIMLTDLESGECVNVLAHGQKLKCIHRPGYSVFKVTALDVDFEITIFVTREDPCEIWLVNATSRSRKTRKFEIRFEQIWAVARFDSHTAAGGIPYVSCPGDNMIVNCTAGGLVFETDNPDLPFPLNGFFVCPSAKFAQLEGLAEEREQGDFNFYRCELGAEFTLYGGGGDAFEIVACAETDSKLFETLIQKYSIEGAAAAELKDLKRYWRKLESSPHCETPAKDFDWFLNFWLKNQLNLNYQFVRAGQCGYRDTLQDVWGFILLDPVDVANKLIDILSHQNSDGVTPGKFPCFEDGEHDFGECMDSTVWIVAPLLDYIKETGDFGFLEQEVPFLDNGSATVAEHVRRALEFLYNHRGEHGMCLTSDSDCRESSTESVWLTVALYDALIKLSELFDAAGREKEAEDLKRRSEKLKKIINTSAWDGKWYLYGFTGKGEKIGSRDNAEGKIHLNPQTWSVFSGLADSGRAGDALKSVDELLGTPLGPALLTPPYVNEVEKAGRISKFEPGTFENGSIYQHAVAFYILAKIADGKKDEAVKAFLNLLPTNPENFDSRRTSEPYCTGNFYCGPDHPRFGQNFFSWFTGSASHLLRIGFDHILGVKAGFDGLEISPNVPDDWDKFNVSRLYRGCVYNLNFERAEQEEQIRIVIDGEEFFDIIPVYAADKIDVTIFLKKI